MMSSVSGGPQRRDLTQVTVQVTIVAMEMGRAESHRDHKLLQDGVFIRCNEVEKENFILKGRTLTSCDGNRTTSGVHFLYSP